MVKQQFKKKSAYYHGLSLLVSMQQSESQKIKIAFLIFCVVFMRRILTCCLVDLRVAG